MDRISDLIAQLRSLGCAVVVAKPEELGDLISRTELTILLNREKERIISERRQERHQVQWSAEHY